MIKTILATISAMLIVEGFILAVFPKQTKKFLKKFIKNKKEIVKFGLIELIIAFLIILLISF